MCKYTTCQNVVYNTPEGKSLYVTTRLNYPQLKTIAQIAPIITD